MRFFWTRHKHMAREELIPFAAGLKSKIVASNAIDDLHAPRMNMLPVRFMLSEKARAPKHRDAGKSVSLEVYAPTLGGVAVFDQRLTALFHDHLILMIMREHGHCLIHPSQLQISYRCFDDNTGFVQQTPPRHSQGNKRNSCPHPSHGHLSMPEVHVGRDDIYWAVHQAWIFPQEYVEQHFLHRQATSTQMQYRNRYLANPHMRHPQSRYSNSQRELPRKIRLHLF